MRFFFFTEYRTSVLSCTLGLICTVLKEGTQCHTSLNSSSGAAVKLADAKNPAAIRLRGKDGQAHDPSSRRPFAEQNREMVERAQLIKLHPRPQKQELCRQDRSREVKEQGTLSLLHAHPAVKGTRRRPAKKGTRRRPVGMERPVKIGGAGEGSRVEHGSSPLS